jgi:transposase
VKVRDFLRVARAHQLEESLRAFMDPLADAVSCATKWLKSSLEKLFEKASGVGRWLTLRRMKRSYQTDLTDAEWKVLEPHLPHARS